MYYAQTLRKTLRAQGQMKEGFFIEVAVTCQKHSLGDSYGMLRAFWKNVLGRRQGMS